MIMYPPIIGDTIPGFKNYEENIVEYSDKTGVVEDYESYNLSSNVWYPVQGYGRYPGATNENYIEIIFSHVILALDTTGFSESELDNLMRAKQIMITKF